MTAPAVTLSLLAPDDPEWAAALARLPHDVYHLASYAALSAERLDGEAFAVHARSTDGELLLPLIQQPIAARPGWNDVLSPYGYPGPVVSFGEHVTPVARAAFLAEAVDRMTTTLRERKVLTAFVRLHPLMADSLEVFAARGCFVRHGHTVAMDLTVSDEEMWHQLRPNHRRGIRRGQRLGHRVLHDTTWGHLDGFVAIYEETMDRVQAAPAYYFDAPAFIELRAALGPERLHLFMVMDGAHPLGGALFTETHGILQYHLGGTFTKALPLHPHKLLYFEVARWAKERGNRVLHLGGGRAGREDSLYQFKAGFSRIYRPFYTWRHVIEPDAASDTPGLDIGPTDSEFFPAYRERDGTPATGSVRSMPVATPRHTSERRIPAPSLLRRA